MSRSRRRVETLASIAGIRAIAARLAEAKCVAADRDVVAAKRKQKQQQDHLELTVSGWERAIGASTFDPASNGFWGHAINNSVAEVEIAGDNVAQKNGVLNRDRSQLSVMIANERCAHSLLSKARKKRLSEIEDRHLAEQADRITRLEMRR
jgi:hypothetical protein